VSALPDDPRLSAASALERDLDLRYYAELLWQRRVLLAAAALGGLLLGGLAGELAVPRYRARALLQVMPPNPTSLSVTDALVQTGNPLRDRQFFNTQLNVLHSRAIAERVVAKLKLPPPPGGADAAGFLLRSLSVEPIPETYVVAVEVTHGDPKDAALWANTLVDVYMDYSIEGQVEAARRAYEWVNERLAETQAGMQEAQDKLLRSYKGQDVFVPEGAVSTITTSIARLTDDHILAQARRIELEAVIGDFAEMRRLGRPLAAIPQVGDDPTIAEINGQLQTLTLELASLRGKYKEGHPEVAKVQVQIQQLRRDYDARVIRIEEGLHAEHRQLLRREAELQQAIEAHKARAAEQSRKLTELDSLKRRADSAAGLYGVLLQKLNETNIASSIQNNNIRLLDRAVAPTRPYWPRKQRLALIALGVGLLLGAGWVLLRDALDDTLKTTEDVERHLHLEVLAVIPRYGARDAALATEAYQNLRTALIFARRAGSGHTVLVTGTAPGEGKTTTLLNLARLLAVSGESVVVVDCDLRRANLHVQLDVPREPGLTDFFVESLDPSSVVRPTRFPGLSVIPSGRLPPHPPALLARPEIGTLLAALEGRYRWVLVDSPPIAAVTDALLLAPHSDSTLLVVQQNKVDRATIKRAAAALRKVTPHLIGAVLNAVDVKTKGYYGYHDYEAKADRDGPPAAPRDSERGDA
jgi:succinoglycan biosynthesis transport protein ExoP